MSENNCKCECDNNQEKPHRVVRFDSIFDNRDKAIEKLGSLSRYYGEIVAIRYYRGEGTSDIYVILAFYLSSVVGNYQIIYDTFYSNENLESSIIKKIGAKPKFYVVNRSNSSQSDLDIIKVKYQNQEPGVGDIIAIKNPGLGSESLYVYYSNDWLQLGESFSLETEDTDTAKLNLNHDDILNKYILSVSIPLDLDNFKKNSDTGNWGINRIDGGGA